MSQGHRDDVEAAADRAADRQEGTSVLSPAYRVPFYAVLSGPVPDRGAATHEAALVHWSGSGEKADRVRAGQLDRSDQVIPLDTANPDANAHWLVLGSTQAVENAPSILVVEDNDLNRAFYGTTLSQITDQIHLASTAAEATAITENHTIDLALVDIRLPDANGFEVGRSILSMETGRNTRVLLMSAYRDLADPQKVTAAGAAGFVMNPIAPDELLRTVEEHLHQTVTSEPQQPATVTDDNVSARVLLFGNPRVEVDGQEVQVPPGRSAELLATLATCCPSAVTSEQIARLAWTSSRDVSFGAIYTAISRLRSFLSDAGAPEIIGSGADGYYLNVQPSQIDLVAFEEAAADLYRHPDHVDMDELQAVMDLWGPGPPFSMPSNHLLTRWESRLMETHARLSEDLAGKATLLGDYGKTISIVTDLLDREPWRESAWTMLAKALYRSGRTNDALRTIAEARQRLREDLGLDPGPALVALEAMILTHDPALLSD